MALTALQKKKIRERIVAKLRDRGYTKARRAFRTGKKMSEVGWKRKTPADLDQLLADGKITQAQFDRRTAARQFAKQHRDKMGAKGTRKKIYQKAAQKGKQHEHKVQKTGVSNFKIDPTVKRKDFSNVGEVRRWKHAKQVQLKNLVRAGKMTKSRRDALRRKVEKRANRLMARMS